mgnify:CR=1 FL=1
MKLRDNQIEPVRLGVQYFKEPKPVPSLIVAPTAFGKSIVIAKIAKEVGEKILVIQPSKELLEQNYEKFIKLGGEAEIYSASLGEKEIGDVTYATIGSIVNVAWKFKELGITKVIIDECDRFPREPDGMLRRFLKAAGIKWTLGFTATPLKLQTNMGRDGSPISKLVMLTSRSKKGNFFKKIIHVEQISNMVNRGYWSPLEYFSFDFDTGDLIYNTTGADFTQKSIEKAYRNQDLETKIVKKIEQLYSRRSILIAVPSIDQAKSLANKLPSAKAVYSQMPIGERREIIEDFKSGNLRTIVQVNILSVGFDYPELDTIIIGRPTASLSWYYQFVGRVTRIHPQKTEGIVIDFVGSVPKFGKVEELYFKKDETKWKLFGENKKLLTGIPMNEIGLHIEGQPSPYEQFENSKPVIMTFGKYKGKEIRFIPKYYRDWMLNNFQWNKTNEHIKQEILKLNNLNI